MHVIGSGIFNYLHRIILNVSKIPFLINQHGPRARDLIFFHFDLSRADEISSLIEPITIFLWYYLLINFFYYFPPLPALCMEIRVWIFSSRLPASDCRKEKKENKSRQQNLSPAIIIVVCMLRCRELYYSISFSYFVILISRWWCCRSHMYVCGIVVPYNLLLLFISLC